MLAPVTLDPSWIVHRDAHFVVVDKPAGLATIDREQGAESALVPLLEAHLAEHLPGQPAGRLAGHLPVLSRLDRETSGLIAFPLTREAQEAMVRAQGTNALQKRYVAAVSLLEGARAPSGRMEDLLASEGGSSRVLDASSGRGRGRDLRHARRAIAHAEPLRTREDRALVAVTLETGRTHQIRVQLAHRGAPVAGDSLYGGALAPRLLLSSVALTLPHPTRGPIEVRREAPALFERWIDGTLSLEEGYRAALPVARMRRAELLQEALRDERSATTAYRLFSERGDGLEGLAIDVYGEHLVVHLHDCALDEGAILEPLAELGARGIYLKRRPKVAHDLSRRDLEAHAPREPVRGEGTGGTQGDELVVREHGVPFLCRLGDGMSTGLFLDQRENRRRVREWAEGRDVLNLFAYTCAFSVAAAVGGARSTLSVDASRVALDRGRANLALSGFEGPAHRVIADDVFDALARLAKRGERFGLVILDPPTFSTTKRSRWTSGKAWAGLFARALRVLAPGGRLLATSNDRRMSQASFRDLARAGAQEADTPIARLVDLAPPLDFRVDAASAPLLKSLLVERA